MANTSPSMDSRLSILSPEPELGARTARLEEVTDHSDALDAQTSSGIGLGPIHRRFLERETWPLDPPESILQYRKFVKLMIDRIRAGESNTEELDGFLGLFDTGENWQYMVPVLGMLPELVEPGPQATNIHMTILLGHVGRFIDAKQKERADRIANSYPAPPKVPQDAEALKAEVRERVAKALFGPRGEKQATPAMTRLLTSTVEMFFSGEGAQQIIDENDKHGKDIDRDSLGLPTGLREFRSRSPKSTPEAPRKVTPCLLPKPAPGSPAPPVLQVPTESSSSDDGVDRQKSISHGLFKPADSASPPSSDDPPSTLTPNSSDEEKGVPNGLKSIPAAAAAAAVPLPPSNPATVPRPGFWDFVSTHSPEYADGVGPIYCKNWGIGRVKWCPSLSVSRKVTEEGTIVVEGFEKPPPETRYAILKEIDDAAARFNALIFAHEDELLSRQLAREEAREQAQQLSSSDDDDDDDILKRDVAELRRRVRAAMGGDECAVEDSEEECEMVGGRKGNAELVMGRAVESGAVVLGVGRPLEVDGVMVDNVMVEKGVGLEKVDGVGGGG